ncbi:MAG: DegT/DnrJ/EryC1/StrS family aminotransferase [Deltaproteobacteria bacterium]|nr:DegT/DnrJ/EryC1/StrS family aminotransferase [Deltaproteobacteria bacterium]
MKFIDLNRQYQAYKQEIDEAVSNVLESGVFILGPVLEELETSLAAFTGVQKAVGVGSGTDGLLLALMAIGVGPNDTVITTPFSFFATAEAIMLLGAKPVFVDIDPLTYNMDTAHLLHTVEALKNKGERPKAILPVSLYGQCADMDEICETARTADIPVIEDACQSFGATYKNRRSCGLSLMGVTSFFPSKPLGAYGEGGMIFTNDPELADELRSLRVHGQKQHYQHTSIGLNARLDAIQAAVLLTKFKHFPKEIVRRQERAMTYGSLFQQYLPEIQLPHIKPDRTSVFAQYTIRLPDDKRARVVEHLKTRGIPTAIHYPTPLHLQPACAHLNILKGSLPHAEQAAKEVLSLPMHPFMLVQEQEMVVTAIKEALAKGH